MNAMRTLRGLTDLIEIAQEVVDVFDQANTGDAVRKLGSRGDLACKAVNNLRDQLVKLEHPPILKESQ